MQDNGWIKWTDEEWAAVAQKAKALKTAKPNLSWLDAALVSQDGIDPERRRFNFKPNALKPMYEILGLDDQGNVPPPPPPPAPEPPPAPVEPPKPAVTLQTIPIAELLTEIFSRSAELKGVLDTALACEARVKGLVEEHAAKVQSVLTRIDEVESVTLKCMDKVDAMHTTMHNFIEHDRQTSMKYDKLLKHAPSLVKNPETGRMLDQIAACRARHNNGSTAAQPVAQAREFIALRFLIVGVHSKSLAQIRNHLPPECDAELILGDNDAGIKLPSNVHYCLVSGHLDCTRRWIQCRDTYGNKAFRLSTASITEFAKKIQELALAHYSLSIAADEALG